MDSICDACLAIDFDKAINHPVEMLSQFPRCELVSDATRFIHSPSPKCPLCRLLSNTVFEIDDSGWSDPRIELEMMRYPYVLHAQSFLADCPWAPKGVQDVQDCCILLALGGLGITASSSSSFIEGKSGYVVCLPKQRKGGPFMPEVVSETFDLAKAKAWLRSCKATHGSSCSQHFEPIQVMKVIDCQNLTIRSAQPGMVWVALSYVWGHADASLDQYGEALPPVLPKTVHDAIQVTKDLGYRYLWIDRYCINQTCTDKAGQEEKALQISLMDQIYRGADLTIVAAAGSNAEFGLPGIGTTTKRRKQQLVELERCTILSTGPDPVYETAQSHWASRGWTFQEASLSRRRLIFTEHQSWFECGKASWMEALGELEHMPISEQAPAQPPKDLGRSLYRFLLSIPQRSSAGFLSPTDRETAIFLDHFFRVVKTYSKRRLTFDSDALNAIAGICGHFQKSRPQVSYLLGIPYVPSPSDTVLEEKYFCYGLSWFHRSGSTGRRRDCFPSWTWAGWAGPVDWMTGRYDGEGSTKAKARRFRFECRKGKPVPATYYLNKFNPETHPLSGIDATLCLQAQLVPPALFSCHGPQQIPSRTNSSWSSDDENEDQEEEHGSENEKSNSRTSEIGSANRPASFGTVSEDDESNRPEKEPVTPDPSDWTHWKVGRHWLWDRSQPPDCDPPTFIERLENGTWSCFLFCDYSGNGGFSRRRCLLVLEWLDDGLAHRVASIIVNCQYYIDEYKWFDDTDFSWQAIRLV